MTHLKIEQNNSAIEQVSSAVITKLYELATSDELDQSSNLVGRLHTDATYQQYIDGIRNNYPNLYISSDKTYFAFQDPEVLRLMSTTFGDGNGVTDLQLLSISSLNNIFRENNNIVSFGELGSITGVTLLNATDFYKCENLEYVDLSNITSIETYGGMAENYAFSGCKNLFKDVKIVHMPKLTQISGKIFGYNTAENVNPYIKMILMESVVYSRKSNFPFDGCSNLQAIILPKMKYISSNETSNYISLSGDYYHANYLLAQSKIYVLELGAINSISKNALRSNTSLLAVVLREQDIVPTLSGYESGNQLTLWLPNANCNIFVPDSLVATMQADSVWSNFSSHIKPISEYDFSDYIDDTDLINCYNSVFNTQQS